MTGWTLILKSHWLVWVVSCERAHCGWFERVDTITIKHNSTACKLLRTQRTIISHGRLYSLMIACKLYTSIRRSNEQLFDQSAKSERSSDHPFHCMLKRTQSFYPAWKTIVFQLQRFQQYLHQPRLNVPFIISVPQFVWFNILAKSIVRICSARHPLAYVPAKSQIVG